MDKHAKLKSARQAAQLSQGALAKIANIDQAQISRMEVGDKWASIDTLKLIAPAVGLPLHELVDEPTVFAPSPTKPLPDTAKKVAADDLLPGGLRKFAKASATAALNITAGEWQALASLKLPTPTDADGYTTMLFAIRSVTKT